MTFNDNIEERTFSSKIVILSVHQPHYLTSQTVARSANCLASHWPHLRKSIFSVYFRTCVWPSPGLNMHEQEVLESARQDVKSFHNRISAAALIIARKINVDESLPRTGRQQHRCNVPSSSPSEYYKCQLTIPALDYLTSEISERFSSCFSTMLSQIMMLLPLSVAESNEGVTSAHINDLITFYKDDLPIPSSIDTELHCWTVER